MNLKQLTALNWTLKKIEGDELIEVRRKHDGLLIACPTNINHEALEQKLLCLDQEHSQIWVAYDRMRNEQV